MKKTLVEIIEAEIRIIFTEQHTFMVKDLHPMAIRLGIPLTRLSSALNNLRQKGVVEKTGVMMRNLNGGGALPLHRLVPAGREVAAKRDFKMEALNKAEQQNLASLAVQAALDNITRRAGR